ncbi:hypothetical protein [Yoonia sp.]|uniref:hypothetical protein n=1 Tax=Yoonia sp. TaxID=2212373 RepID=UPI002DF8C2FD|nr:hypothetical protein [Yoonia sp.]
MQTQEARAALDGLKRRIADTTPATVLTNPQHIRDTAMITADLIGQVLELIDAIAPYTDETPTGGA